MAVTRAAEEQQGVRRRGAERCEQGEALAPAAARDPGGEARADQDVDEEAEQGLRGGQVGRDRFAGVPEPDGLPAQVRLEADEQDRSHGRPQERATITVVDERDDRLGQDESARASAAIVRWSHSIQAFGSSSLGSSWPWQNGQSGQPRPESVARTMTPTVTSRRVPATVVAASFWKRVTTAF